MKNVESTLKKMLPTAIYAMASSILTELLLDFLMESTYTGQYRDGYFEVIPQSNFATWQVIALSIAIFGTIWVCLGVIVPNLLSLLTRLSYRPFRRYSRVDVVSIYNSVRANVMKIAETLSGESFTYQSQNSFIFLDLIKNTKKLTDVFMTTNMRRKLLKRSYFRRCVTIDDVERYVSPYELSALITLMEELLQETYNSCPNEFKAKSDFDEANRRLNILKIDYCKMNN